MKLITVSLKDDELKALTEIMQTKNINCLHRVVKVAIEDFIKRFMENRGT